MVDVSMIDYAGLMLQSLLLKKVDALPSAIHVFGLKSASPAGSACNGNVKHLHISKGVGSRVVLSIYSVTHGHQNLVLLVIPG